MDGNKILKAVAELAEHGERQVHEGKLAESVATYLRVMLATVKVFASDIDEERKAAKGRFIRLSTISGIPFLLLEFIEVGGKITLTLGDESAEVVE